MSLSRLGGQQDTYSDNGHEWNRRYQLHAFGSDANPAEGGGYGPCEFCHGSMRERMVCRHHVIPELLEGFLEIIFPDPFGWSLIRPGLRNDALIVYNCR